MITETMTLTLNGKPRDFPAGTSLPAVIEALGIDRRAIAVALNGDVIPRTTYDSVVLHHGDEVEIVRMVGGG